jgi:uncharacterized protein involved in exopolysaccharide biosynthesis
MHSKDEPTVIETPSRPGRRTQASRERQTSISEPSYGLIVSLWAYRKLIIGMVLLGAVAGLVAALLIPSLYKSEVVIFPAVTHSPSKALFNDYPSGREDILGIGDEEDNERLLQILHSDKIRDRVAEKFKLYDAYGIEPDSKHRRAELIGSYERHVTFENTKYNSVRIEVLHRDPETAASMADFIAAQVDTVWKEMAQDRAQKAYDMVKAKFDKVEEDIAMITDSMRVLHEMGVQGYETQTERMYEYLGAAILKGDRRAVDDIEGRFKSIAGLGGVYLMLEDRLKNEMYRHGTLSVKLAQTEVDLQNDIPHKFVVNAAQVSDKRAYPVRWLVVVMSTISAFLIAMLIVVVQENIKKVRLGHAG